MRVIITTIHADPENLFPAFRDECDGYVVKPVYKAALDNLVAGFEAPA